MEWLDNVVFWHWWILAGVLLILELTSPVFFFLWLGFAAAAVGFILLMAIELMLLSVNMNFIAFSYFLDDLAGQVFVFFILTVAAAEAAIGLAILVVLFRNRSTINVEELDELKG